MTFEYPVPVNAKPGDFQLVDVTSDNGKLIRFAQILNGDGFGHFEHAALYVGNNTVIEAEPGGARMGEARRHSKTLWSTGIIELTDAERRKIVDQGHLCLGVGYSAADYFAIAARHFHIPAPHLKAYVASSGHMICSQLVAYCYMKGGHPLFGSEWTGYVTPGDLWQLLGKDEGLF